LYVPARVTRLATRVTPLPVPLRWPAPGTLTISVNAVPLTALRVTLIFAVAVVTALTAVLPGPVNVTDPASGGDGGALVPP